jgi:hypothetical protein
VSASAHPLKCWDDSAFAASDDFVEPDVLHDAGKTFYRK